MRGTPSHHPFLDGVVPNKPSSYGQTQLPLLRAWSSEDMAPPKGEAPGEPEVWFSSMGSDQYHKYNIMYIYIYGYVSK